MLSDIKVTGSRVRTGDSLIELVQCRIWHCANHQGICILLSLPGTTIEDAC